SAAQGPLPFGRIELNLWATAVKRPPLADVPAKPREPYGVAELFRQCLDSARTFRRRRQLAGRRLNFTLAGPGAVVGLMVLVAVGLVLTRKGTEASGLEARVRTVRAEEAGGPVELFRDPEKKLKQLEEIQKEPYFTSLPQEMQDYIRRRYDDLK